MSGMDYQTHPNFDVAWRELLSRLPDHLDLDQSAREHGALKRRRVVRDGATLLRLALAYGPAGMSLRSAAAWAAGCDIAHLSDVGLLKRLKGANEWLSFIAASLLHDDIRGRYAERRLRVVDGSVIRSSGKGGSDWRLHATYDPAEGRFSDHSRRYCRPQRCVGAGGIERSPARRGMMSSGMFTCIGLDRHSDRSDGEVVAFQGSRRCGAGRSLSNSATTSRAANSARLRMSCANAGGSPSSTR